MFLRTRRVVTYATPMERRRRQVDNLGSDARDLFMHYDEREPSHEPSLLVDRRLLGRHRGLPRLVVSNDLGLRVDAVDEGHQQRVGVHDGGGDAVKNALLQPLQAAHDRQVTDRELSMIQSARQPKQRPAAKAMGDTATMLSPTSPSTLQSSLLAGP